MCRGLGVDDLSVYSLGIHRLKGSVAGFNGWFRV